MGGFQCGSGERDGGAGVEGHAAVRRGSTGEKRLLCGKCGHRPASDAAGGAGSGAVCSLSDSLRPAAGQSVHAEYLCGKVCSVLSPCGGILRLFSYGDGRNGYGGLPAFCAGDYAEGCTFPVSRRRTGCPGRGKPDCRKGRACGCGGSQRFRQDYAVKGAYGSLSRVVGKCMF